MISVAMATFNGGRFLKQQLRSIFEQSVRPDEIVITDDCSSDDTVQIIEHFQRLRDIRIILSRNVQRLGYVKNFEKAVGMCSGEEIFLSDQDNIWFPSKVERQVSTDRSALLVYSDAVLVDERGTTISESYSLSCKIDILDSSFVRILCNNMVSGCTTMIRKRLICPNPAFPDWLPHDQWLALLASDKGLLAYVPDSLMAFRQHDNNVLGAGSIYQSRRIDFLNHKEKELQHREKAFMLDKTFEFARAILSQENLRTIKEIAEYHSSVGRKESALKAAALYWKYSRYVDIGIPWTMRSLKGLATVLRFL